MHGNRRYVKLAWIGFLAGLAVALPSPGHAEIVPLSAENAFLAVARDGTPNVAGVFAQDLYIASRRASGWAVVRPGRLPGRNAAVVGLVVDPKGVATALAEDDGGAWLALGSRGRLTTLARAPKGASFGPAGLTLDAAGRPAIAYAVRHSSRKTFLRLVTTDGHGRLRTRAVTKRGFPASESAPGAVPVLVGSRLHVVETYTSAAIDWQPQKKGGWVGQYLFASRTGTPAGRVGGVAAGRNLWSAWTQLYPDTLSVLLTLSATTQETNVVVPHGIFVSLLVADGQPEIGAYDWAEIGDWRTYVGVIADRSGAVTELDGRLEGYVIAPGDRRQLLLSTESGLEWFDALARPAIRVSLSADASGRLTGRVTGAQGGNVALYREQPNGPRLPVATVQLAPDGSFAGQDDPPSSRTLYRAVYREPNSGVPYASLIRTPVG